MAERGSGDIRRPHLQIWGNIGGDDRFNEACYVLDTLLEQLQAERDR